MRCPMVYLRHVRHDKNRVSSYAKMKSGWQIRNDAFLRVGEPPYKATPRENDSVGKTTPRPMYEIPLAPPGPGGVN